ncbi:hypothetical protein [Rhodovulum sulfidophilum]|uniref:hypothetical protein n=1 Tax=Rhodovulum sulfidophilum TaxID=35806 RepID=UPI0013899F6C|nr:hypothetical protein [Rhodovulum sulfidophilum]NDK34377.1 hypothetical protein [Rhodovulum sulfidophilum]
MLRRLLRGLRGGTRAKGAAPQAAGARAAPLPDDTPFGEDLARRAVAFLETTSAVRGEAAIVRMHRDYTGHGLFHDRAAGRFFLSRSLDGWPCAPAYLSFADAAGFRRWLAAQSDASLSGQVPSDIPGFERDPGNQRITRSFVEDYLRRHGNDGASGRQGS